MSPQAFDNCQKNGGRIGTITLKNNRYMRVCYLNGKSHPGEVKKTKENK